MNNQQKPTSVTQIYERLAEPFDWDDIEIMPAKLSVKGDQAKSQALAYFDARAVMNRLDEVVGCSNWELTDVEYFTIAGKNGCRGKLVVRIWDDEAGAFVTVSRTEVAELSDIEAVKGGLSNVLKRCFSALANRTLYTVDFGWQVCETYKGQDGKARFSKFPVGSLANMKRIYEAAVKESKARIRIIGSQNEPDDEPEQSPKPEPKKVEAPPKEEKQPQGDKLNDDEAALVLDYLRELEASTAEAAGALAAEYREKTKGMKDPLPFRRYLLTIAKMPDRPGTVAALRDTFGDPFATD